MQTKQIFPFIIIVLNVGAAIVYAVQGNFKMFTYFIAAAVLNITVNF